MRSRVLAPLILCLPLLVGFTGNEGVEVEGQGGIGIGHYRAQELDEPFGELGGLLRYKFRHFPYSDMAGWLQLGLSWQSFPYDGSFGERPLSVAFLGGFVRDWGEWGAGVAIVGNTRDEGGQFAFPAFHLAIGRHDRVRFAAGMLDGGPIWTNGGFLHAEVIVAVPPGSPWAPHLKGGVRFNPYDFGRVAVAGLGTARVPLELAGGVVFHLGKHLRVGGDAVLGDGGGGAPSFQLAAYVGFAVGRGTKYSTRPEPTP